MSVLKQSSIEETYGIIKPYIRLTPTINLDAADFGISSCRVTLKLEQLQYAGSFKPRGAFANLLMRDVPPAGVVAASGGNHGAAVAYAAMRLGIRAKIFVPTVSSPAKIARIQGYGAELTVIGDRYDDALPERARWARQNGAVSIHDFDEFSLL